MQQLNVKDDTPQIRKAKDLMYDCLRIHSFKPDDIVVRAEMVKSIEDSWREFKTLPELSYVLNGEVFLVASKDQDGIHVRFADGLPGDATSSEISSEDS